MVDPVEAAARSIAKDCGSLAFAEHGEQPVTVLYDREHWRRVARNALAASVVAAQAMNEAEDAGRTQQS